jgi:hypothetical protein
VGRRGSQHEHELFIAIEGTTASMRLQSFAMGSYLHLLFVCVSLIVFQAIWTYDWADAVKAAEVRITLEKSSSLTEGSNGKGVQISDLDEEGQDNEVEERGLLDRD